MCLYIIPSMAVAQTSTTHSPLTASSRAMSLWRPSLFSGASKFPVFILTRIFNYSILSTFGISLTPLAALPPCSLWNPQPVLHAALFLYHSGQYSNQPERMFQPFCCLWPGSMLSHYDLSGPRPRFPSANVYHSPLPTTSTPNSTSFLENLLPSTQRKPTLCSHHLATGIWTNRIPALGIPNRVTPAREPWVPVL